MAKQAKKNKELIIKGIPSSYGIAIGPAVVIKSESVIMPSIICEIDIPEEIKRFEIAQHDLIDEFTTHLSKSAKESKNVFAILESNLLILKDPFLNESIRRRIKDGFPVESAVILEFDHQKQFFQQSKDKLLKEKSFELDNIKENLLSYLRNRSVPFSIEAGSIVIAKSVSPTDIVNFHHAGVKGIVTEVGGIASHASILARSFEMPAVIGVNEVLLLIDDNIDIIIDGYSGTIICNPTPATHREYLERKSKEELHRKELGALVKLSSTTRDGKPIKLCTNIDFIEDIDSSTMVGAEGIGLVRSEHLLMALQHFPSEEEQYQWYLNMAQRTYPNNITIRVFDVGSDKFAEGMPHHESNPALGFRGIRFLLSRLDIFETQIYAILRASKNKNVRIMLPMVTSLREVQSSIELIERCKKSLDTADIAFDRHIPVGIMIETPAAALKSKDFASHVSFFSIGTNDLTQYTLAADRGNELVSDVFDSFHPAVLQLIKITIDSAKEKKISVSVCGELAGHSGATAMLIGMGINELSVSPRILLELKNRIRSINYEEAVKLAGEVLSCSSRSEVRAKLSI
ncbi:MAG: Phosphoenolpyruvate--protein phosphotransferase [Ignavibacteria bacterium]|nr:Phosphoenolpyruvate--protein phosphotransferase [Ignavibacteria bacterium]